MNTLRITMSGQELDDVLHFLHHYTEGHSPAHVRSCGGSNVFSVMVAQLIPTLCARLSIRLATARLTLKQSYRMHLPAELALGLVLAWLEQGGDRWPAARMFIGNLHRALA